MKQIIPLIVSLYLIITSIFSLPFNEIERAFTKGDAESIVNLGTSKMLISIEGKEGIYSKSQGIQVLHNFFASNPPKSFSFKFKGKEDAESTFAIGDYVSIKKFNVSIKLKKKNQQYAIESITITSTSK